MKPKSSGDCVPAEGTITLNTSHTFASYNKEF
jgi:hypothetical protein